MQVFLPVYPEGLLMYTFISFKTCVFKDDRICKRLRTLLNNIQLYKGATQPKPHSSNADGLKLLLQNTHQFLQIINDEIRIVWL